MLSDDDVNGLEPAGLRHIGVTTRELELPIVANRKKLNAFLDRELPEELFDLQPWGHRIVIYRDEPLRKTAGGIHVPDSAQIPPARGRVVSVGHLVGSGGLGGIGECPYPRENLLGALVLFGAYAGKSLKLKGEDDEFFTMATILTENEVWGLVGSLPEVDLR